MFLPLIAALTAAVTVQGFPQQPLFQQYQVRFLPVITVPDRGLHDYNRGSRLQNVVVYELNEYQSENLRSDVTTNAKLQEPYRKVDSAFVNSEFVKKNDHGPSSYEIQDTFSLRTEVRPRNNFLNNGVIHDNERYAQTDQISDSISKNNRPTEVSNQRSEFTSRKPEIIPKRGFIPKDNIPKLENTVNDRQENNRNPNTVLNSTEKSVRHPETQSFKTNSSRDNHRNRDISQNHPKHSNPVSKININVNTQTKDSNFTLKTGNENDKPVQHVSALNGSAAGFESAMQAPAKTPMNSNTSDALAPGFRSDMEVQGNADEGDRWVWNVTERVETTTPDIENRVSFDGGSCPTGKIKVAGMCVPVDKD